MARFFKNLSRNFTNSVNLQWNWPYSRKDFEVYGERGYAIATGANGLRVRLDGANSEETRTPTERTPEERDSISYLVAVARGKFKPYGLNSLENNVVVEILDAARESIRTGRTVTLSK